MSLTDVIIIAVLLALNLWQHWFWSKYTAKLIDKLMCRNYAEYKQVEQSRPLPPQARTQGPQVVTEDAVLEELNSMLGGN